MFPSRQVLLRLSGLVAGCAGLWLAWSQAPQQPAVLTMAKISPNLYVIQSMNSGNVAVMPTNEGVLVVDDKFAVDGPELMNRIKSVTSQPIRYVLNTHQHGDHTGGNEAMKMQNASVIMHKNARANLVTLKQPGLSQITFADETQVFLGGLEVRARHLGRGHTNGDAVIYFPSERVLHTGDLFVNGGAPFIDTNNGGSIKEWDKTVQAALQLDFDTVIPGHGPVGKKADLVKWVQTLGTLRSRIGDASKGGAAEDAAKRLNLEGLNMTPSPIFANAIPGVCKELAK